MVTGCAEREDTATATVSALLNSTMGPPCCPAEARLLPASPHALACEPSRKRPPHPTTPRSASAASSAKVGQPELVASPPCGEALPLSPAGKVVSNTTAPAPA
jgi:hypothetical protein